MRTIVVSLQSGAGVVRGEHGLIVTDDVTKGRGVYLREDDRFHPGATGIEDDRCVVGGLLPPGAVSAEVVDDRGTRVTAAVADGVYAAILEQPYEGGEPIVCCRDADGKPVRRPRAADYPSVRVSDAEEPCPACGATDWDEYTPFEDWRGGSGSKVDGTNVPNPVVSCRVCGHEEPEGTFTTFGSESSDSEDEATRQARIGRFRAEFRKRRWLQNAELLRTLQFPIYVADGWSSQIVGHSTQDGRLTALKVDHYDVVSADPWSGDRPRLTVTTKSGEPYPIGLLSEARQTLEHWAGQASAGAEWPKASHAAITLWLRARARDRRAAVLNAIRSEQPITIDGTTVEALVLTAPDGYWVAAAGHDDGTIIVAARDLDPATLRLESVKNTAELLGPEPPDA